MAALSTFITGGLLLAGIGQTAQKMHDTKKAAKKQEDEIKKQQDAENRRRELFSAQQKRYSARDARSSAFELGALRMAGDARSTRQKNTLGGGGTLGG